MIGQPTPFRYSETRIFEIFGNPLKGDDRLRMFVSPEVIRLKGGNDHLAGELGPASRNQLVHRLVHASPVHALETIDGAGASVKASEADSLASRIVDTRFGIASAHLRNLGSGVPSDRDLSLRGVGTAQAGAN